MVERQSTGGRWAVGGGRWWLTGRTDGWVEEEEEEEGKQLAKPARLIRADFGPPMLFPLGGVARLPLGFLTFSWLFGTTSSKLYFISR
jgi:hypothetical protein